MVPDIIGATRQEDAPRDTEAAKEAHIIIQQDSTLLKLPIEVFQTITWHMDVATFFTSLLTCKLFLAAAQSRPNLYRHIYSIPGLKLGLDDLTTPDLLLQFRKRAAQSGCAAGVLSDVTLYTPASRIPVSNAVFSPASPKEPRALAQLAATPGTPAQLATVHEGGAIQIYDLGKHHVRHKTELQIKPPPEDENGCRMEILKMAFSPESRDLAVLYRSYKYTKPFESGNSYTSLDCGDPIYRLVTFHRLFAKTKKHFYSSDQQETRDVGDSNEELPVGVALASNGNACITWKTPTSQDVTRISLIGRDDKLMEACLYDPTPEILTIADPPDLPAARYKERLIFNVQFVENDKKLNFYKPGNPIHSWYTPAGNPSDARSAPIFTNTAFLNIEINEDYLEEFAIGMPFHAMHYYSITVDWSPEPMCQTSYLALGVSKNRRESSSHPNVFIVQADATGFLADFDHSANPDEGRKLPSWKPLALLAGYRQGASSLGTVIAVSPKGTKIAAATWSRVIVWSLSPRLLLQGELQHYFPTYDYNSSKGLGRLRPTLLPSQGVVHSMLWTNETQLFATTDQGLAKWDMGHLSEGEKDHLSLAYDAWPDTAVAAPVTSSRPPQCRPRVPLR